MKKTESKINIWFSLIGKNVDLDEITDRLGINPTHVRTLDDWPEAIKNPKNDLPDELQPRYIWQVDIEYETNRLVRDRFDVMLRLMTDKTEIINELKKKFSLKASFTVGIHAQHDQHNMPEVFLTQEIIAFVASIGADIGFDMYLD